MWNPPLLLPAFVSLDPAALHLTCNSLEALRSALSLCYFTKSTTHAHTWGRCTLHMLFYHKLTCVKSASFTTKLFSFLKNTIVSTPNMNTLLCQHGKLNPLYSMFFLLLSLLTNISQLSPHKELHMWAKSAPYSASAVTHSCCLQGNIWATYH